MNGIVKHDINFVIIVMFALSSVYVEFRFEIKASKVILFNLLNNLSHFKIGDESRDSIRRCISGSLIQRKRTGDQDLGTWNCNFHSP